jgi:D-alanine-D-alanine ligase-like ATP-grasp enzyme
MTAAVESRDKTVSKARFKQFGVPTTPGIAWTGHNAAQVQAFVSQFSDKTFVIKPVQGSGAKNTHSGVPYANVLALLESLPKVPMLVEVRIMGPEFRVYVVGNKVAGAYLKTRIFVIGTGTDSIATLIARKNALRASNPSIANCQIDMVESQKHLAQYGVTLDHVPPVKQRVILGPLRNPTHGAESVNVTENLHPAIARAAIGACASVGLPNGGVDLMADAKGAYVLEVNARALVQRHSFPTLGEGSGNSVSEAIVDWYFPTPDGRPAQRHTQIFDNAPLLAAFAKDGSAAYYKLPPAAA